MEIIGSLLIIAGTLGLAIGWYRTAAKLDALSPLRDERGRFVRRHMKGE